MRHPRLKSLDGTVVRCGTPVMTGIPLAGRWRGLLAFLLGALATLCVPAARAAGAAVTFPMYVSSGEQSIVKVDAAGVVTPFVTLPVGSYPRGLAFDGSGNLYAAEGASASHEISKITPAGVVSPFASLPFGPIGLAFDSAGNLYTGGGSFSDAQIDRITPAGGVSLFASVAGIQPRGLAFDAAGNLYAAESLIPDRIDKITPGGAVSLFANMPSNPDGLAFDAAGNLYVAFPNLNQISKITSGGVVSPFATLPAGSFPEGLAFDGSGNLYVADQNTNQISKISPDGLTVTPFATGINVPAFIAFTPVPEPCAAVLLATAAGSLFFRRRRA